MINIIRYNKYLYLDCNFVPVPFRLNFDCCSTLEPIEKKSTMADESSCRTYPRKTPAVKRSSKKYPVKRINAVKCIGLLSHVIKSYIVNHSQKWINQHQPTKRLSGRSTKMIKIMTRKRFNLLENTLGINERGNEYDTYQHESLQINTDNTSIPSFQRVIKKRSKLKLQCRYATLRVEHGSSTANQSYGRAHEIPGWEQLNSMLCHS